MLKQYLVGIGLIIALFLCTQTLVQAQQAPNSQSAEARIVSIIEDKMITVLDKNQRYQKLKLNFINGEFKDKTIIIDHGKQPMAYTAYYKIGDEVVVSFNQDNQGKYVYYITDYVRRDSLLLLVIIFIGITLWVGKWRGVQSLIAMLCSFAIIAFVMMPLLAKGYDPVLVVLGSALFLVPITFLIAHGINIKTFVAIGSTLLALLITSLLALIFVQATKLTGFSSEEAAYLQISSQQGFNILNLLLAGMIVGVLGVLDDITIAQAALVFQLRQTAPSLSGAQLYNKAMEIGRDHIASMVNTLILVYVGASLPLWMLFIANPQPIKTVVNYELIATEIIRSLVGSIGLIVAVPMTTFVATIVAFRRKE